MKLVGLAGYAGAGKDTAALGLLRRGWTRLAFADPLRALAKAVGWNGEKDEAGRRLLQALGHGVRVHVDPDAWVRALEREFETIERAIVTPGVVVTDVRYPNEVAWVHERGGLVVRVDRPGVGPVNGHVSERVDELDVDAVIVNDADEHDLGFELRAVVASAWNRRGERVLV